jgi:hypothetical protein
MTAHRLVLAWTLFCAIASTAWIVGSAARLGATFDEPVYITAGLDRWRQGGIGGLMRLGTMPLAVDAAALPVWLAERARSERYALASDGRGRVVDARDLARVLPLARAGTVIFWWLLLVTAARLALHVAGPLAAAIAVAWIAVEPSLLAHGALATTDIAVTAMLMGFAASWLTRAPAGDGHHTRRVGRTHWLLPGVWFGLAILAKASAIVFAPAIAVALEWSRRDRHWPRFMSRAARAGGVALVFAFLYCGSDWRTEDSFVAWARALPPGSAATAMVAVAEHLPIFSNAGEGLVQQIRHNVRGHDAYVLGGIHERAVWFYFPVITLIKVSGALIVGLAATLVFARPALRNPPMLAAAGLLVLSPLFRVQTGIRLILPIVALGLVGIAAAFAQGLTTDGRRRQALHVIVGLLTAWSLTAAGRSWPDAITFVNEFWGGPSRAHRLVSDSNYDWGQGLPALRRHLAGADPIDLWYWGTDPQAGIAPFRLFDVRAEAPADEAALRARLHGRTLAVSATLLYGTALSPAARVADEDRRAVETAEALRRVLRQQPPTQVGTFFVYRF